MTDRSTRSTREGEEPRLTTDGTRELPSEHISTDGTRVLPEVPLDGGIIDPPPEDAVQGTKKRPR
jgi:hypothetical protein